MNKHSINYNLIHLTDYFSINELNTVPLEIIEIAQQAIDNCIHLGYLKGKTLVSESSAVLRNDQQSMRTEIESNIKAHIFAWMQNIMDELSNMPELEILIEHFSSEIVEKIAQDACQGILENLLTKAT